MPNSGSSAASPNMEEQAAAKSKELDNPDGKLPLHEDIMQLARLGEIGPIQRLLEDGKYDAAYKDEEGITPLHVSYLPTSQHD